jgi:Tfp pilus assembly protein PilF
VDQAGGRPDDAERRYRQALDIKEQLLGAEHPEIGSVCNNLGTLLHEQHRNHEAAQFYRRALNIAERTHPADHPLVAAIRDNLHQLTSAARLRDVSE